VKIALSSELKTAFSGIFEEESDEFVFGAVTNGSMSSKCRKVHVRFRASDQGKATEGKAEMMIFLKNAVGETIASGCKWSQPFLPLEWIEVEVEFDEQDEIVQLAEPCCKYEVWYKVGKRNSDYEQHILCVDYFSVVASDDTSSSSSSSAAASHIEYEQPIHVGPVSEILKI
jgi:hypothetical protein